MKHHTFRTSLGRAYPAFRIAITVGITVASLPLAILLVRPDAQLAAAGLLLPIGALLVIKWFLYQLHGLHRSSWRYVSVRDALELFKAHLLAAIVFSLLLPILTTPPLPVSAVIAEFLLSILLAAGSRLLVRLALEWRRRRECSRAESLEEVAVIGAGVSGQLLVKTLLAQRKLPHRPVAIFDDKETLHGSTIHGVKVVGGLERLEQYLRNNPRVALVVVAIPSLGSGKLDEVRRSCESVHVPLKLVQTFEEMAYDTHEEPRTKITIEEALNREVEIRHEREIHEALSGCSILVTGAGGSIGSELVRQLVRFNPRKIVLLDKSEYNLYRMEQELRSQAPEVEKAYSLGNIVNRPRLKKLFLEHAPEVIFHAAAYKHVPLLETNCYEAFLNNVIGSKNLLEAAKAHGVERLVLISTDKAVDPSSVMGATKRVAELLVSASGGSNVVNGGAPSECSLHTAVVRFGNVINSSGSVIPLFKEQILAGKPVTVTHPEMNRYFMSIREAVRLVLTAGTLGGRGEIYLLDMGKPIKIVDVARKLMALYGRRDLPIVFTGLREGEKLTEQLFSTSEIRTSAKFKKVFVVESRYAPALDVFRWVDDVASRIEQLSEEQIASELRLFHSRRRAPAEDDRFPIPDGIMTTLAMTEESSA